jgi:hypothetical protein
MLGYNYLPGRGTKRMGGSLLNSKAERYGDCRLTWWVCLGGFRSSAPFATDPWRSADGRLGKTNTSGSGLLVCLFFRKVRIHSAPSLRVELESDVAARGEPPRFTPSCCRATMLHAASLDGAVC